VSQILTDIFDHVESELPPQEDCEAAVAVLHCMPTMRPVYAKYGFRSVPAFRSLLNILIPPIRTSVMLGFLSLFVLPTLKLGVTVSIVCFPAHSPFVFLHLHADHSSPCKSEQRC
jgi:hypothetical protein